MRRSKKFLLFTASLLLLASLLMPLFHPGIAHADPGPPGDDKWTPIPITTCQELRDINNNLEATYTLSNNLSCGSLMTIGKDDFGYTSGVFRGHFYGQGHTISNLQVPLFDFVAGGVITNVTLLGTITITDTASHGALVNSLNGGIISDVHVTVTANMNSVYASFGGLAGNANNVSIIRSSAVVNASVTMGQAQYAGLALYLGNSRVVDSYSDNTIVIPLGGGVEHAAGISMFGTDSEVINSYATGSIDHPGEVHEIGGLIWFGSTSTAVHSFSTFAGVGGCNGTDGCGGLITIGSGDLDMSTDYLDQTAAGTSNCTGNPADFSNTTCNRVNTNGSQGNYFKNNTTNGPLSSWDFGTVWDTTVGLPTLRSFSDPAPAPDPADQLSVTINSSTSLNLSWVTPVNSGSSPLLAKQINYRSADVPPGTAWSHIPATDIQSYANPSANFFGNSLDIGPLAPNTSYTFEVILYNQDGYVTVATVNATTPPPGFAIIHTCQQLQDITNDLVDNYALGNNIDCTGSASMNGGLGFRPIGCYGDGNYSEFTGTFAGNNYAISNLYIDGGGSCYWKALFIGT